MALVAYLLIGLPNVLVLALVAGVFEAVPMIGPVLGAIPAAVIAFSIAPSKLIWVIVATLISQQVENNILVPRVMRKSVGVNPFVSLLAFFDFSSLFGIADALMAIPIAAIIQLLLDRFVFHPAALEPDASPGRDYASRLRYEDPRIQHFQVHTVDMDTQPAMPVMADGLVLGEGPLHVSIQRHALTVMVGNAGPEALPS